MINSHMPAHSSNNLYITQDLNIKTRSMGFKVEVAQLTSAAPYSSLIDELRGYSDMLFIHRKLLQNAFKKDLTYRSCSTFILELKDIHMDKLAGLLTFDVDSKNILEVKGLGVFKSYQRNGFGTVLMEHAIEIAQNRGLKKLQLQSDKASTSFYEKKIGMSKVTESNLMQLAIISNDEKRTHLDLRPIKKLANMVDVLGVSKFIP